MIGHLKTLAIVLLAISASVLTVRLWFNELAGSSINNAVLSLFQRAQPETDSGQNFFVKPTRIVTAFSDNRFDIMYNDIDSSIQKRDCDDAIVLALDSGEYSLLSMNFLEQHLSAPAYAYHYTAAMPSATFVNSYPQRRNILTSRVRNFEWVIVKPYGNSRIGVIFIDLEGRAHEYRITDAVLEPRISRNINSLANQSDRLKYAYELGFFIPDAQEFTYPPLRMENQYMDEAGLLLYYVRRRVDVFFDNASKWENRRAQNLTFSDENTVVKYFRAESNTGLDYLEYANYRVIDRRYSTTLVADYNSAIRFIRRDATIENEFYLDRVEESGSKRVFYFNYAVNDIPVPMSDEGKEHTGLSYPIEIELEHGTVTRYRKLVYKFVNADRRTATVSVSYESILNSMLAAEEEPEDLPLDDVSLKYQIDPNYDMMLYWFFELDGLAWAQSASPQ